MTRQVVLALLATGFIATGCGGDDGEDDDVASLSEGDSGDESSDGGDVEVELADWAQCMRDEGIDMPEPTRDADGNLVIEGDGISIGGGGATFEMTDEEDEEPPFTPEDMETAQSTCGPPPGVGEFSEEDLADMEAGALEFAECMRDEGVDDFPDPDFSDMGPGGAPERNTNSGGPDGEGDGQETQVVLGPFGEIDMDDAATASAFEACQDLMGGPRGRPGGPGGPGPESDGADA